MATLLLHSGCWQQVSTSVFCTWNETAHLLAFIEGPSSPSVDVALRPGPKHGPASPASPGLSPVKISTPLRKHFTWSSMEVNGHERVLVTNERTRFELEMTPLICRLTTLEQEFAILQRENLYLEAYNGVLTAKLRENDMVIPRPKYNPAHFYHSPRA